MNFQNKEEEKHAKLIDAAVNKAPLYPRNRFSGRGIIIAAGGARMFTCAWIAIRMLRDFCGCTLPIEVWHLGDREMSPSMKAMLAELNVVTVDALALQDEHPARNLGGWELKVYAILHCRFEDVLLLDADNVALRDPEFLFDGAAYKEHGAIFWPDVITLNGESRIWDICGVEYQAMPSFETGQVLVNKQKCWRALCLTMLLNDYSDFFYRHVYGDKDTFLMAWLRLNQPFAMPEQGVRNLPGVFCQHDMKGDRLFQHRCRRKWVLDGANPPTEGFVEEERCHEYLNELRLRWNGKIFLPPKASAKARRAAEEIEQQCWFSYECVGERTTPFELLPANRIGVGHREMEAFWWTEESADGSVELFIGNGDVKVLRLRRDDFGIWRGRWLSQQALSVNLMPLEGEPETARETEAQGHVTAQLKWDALNNNYEKLD